MDIVQAQATARVKINPTTPYPTGGELRLPERRQPHTRAAHGARRRHQPDQLIKLTAAQLTDGPWCPDVNNANRGDADLLRIRKVAVTIRVEAALDALRGPASALFTRGGTSRGGNKWVPDQEIRFEVSPRNMNLGR